MKLDLQTLTTERQWRSATGFNKALFENPFDLLEKYQRGFILCDFLNDLAS